MNTWINNYWLINKILFIFGLAIIKHGVPEIENNYSKIGVLKVANNHYPFGQDYGGNFRNMEHPAGIEPVQLAWEANVLPLNYGCEKNCRLPGNII